METKKEKTIYDLKLHETLLVEEMVTTESKDDHGVIKKYEVTRVAGGWVYAFEYPGWRQTQVSFVPFSNEFMDLSKPLTKK